MSVDLEARLRALELPVPDDGVERRLLAALALPVPSLRRRRPRRIVAVVALTLLAGGSAVALAAGLDHRLFASFSRHALVSNTFRIDPRLRVGAVDVALRLTCSRQQGALACSPGPRRSLDDSSYRLLQRAGAPVDGSPTTLWMFATGTTVLAAVRGFPPLIACPEPSAARQQVCDPLLSTSVLPLGTPIYSDVVASP